MTFDIDANGILNVSATDSSTNNENRITITNDKGRLSREEIERMVNEAEIYRNDDERQKEKINAKNNLESYCFNMKNTVEDEPVASRIPETERGMILAKCNELIKWMDSNLTAGKEEFEAKLKEAEKVFKRNSRISLYRPFFIYFKSFYLFLFFIYGHLFLIVNQALRSGNHEAVSRKRFPASRIPRQSRTLDRRERKP